MISVHMVLKQQNSAFAYITLQTVQKPGVYIVVSATVYLEFKSFHKSGA